MLKKVLFKARRYDRESLVAKWTKECPVCGKPLPSAKFWGRRHNQIHMREWKDAKKRHQCSCCKKKFRDIANYLRHCASHQKNLWTKNNNKAAARVKLEKQEGTNNAHFEKEPQTGTENTGPDDLSQDEITLQGSEHNLDHWRGTVDCTGSDVSFEPADSSRENRVHVGQLSNGELNLVSSEDGDIQIGHNENTKYHCNFCPKEYLTKHYYEAHLKLHKGSIRFNCEDCQKSFSTSATLKKHRRKKHGHYRCFSCGEFFKTQKLLDEHKEVEMVQRRSCMTCDKIFTSHKALKIHQRIHSGEKPYRCHLCEAAFTQRCHLLDHQHTHTGAQPYACNYCDQFFTTQSSRRRHERRIHKIGVFTKDYQCSVCCCKFSTKYSLDRHSRRHGNVEKVRGKAGTSLIDHQMKHDTNSVSVAKALVGDVSSETDHLCLDEVDGRYYNEMDANKAPSENGQQLEEIVTSDVKVEKHEPTSSVDQEMQNIDSSLLEKETNNLTQGRRQKLKHKVCEICHKSFKDGLSKHLRNVHKYQGNGMTCELCGLIYSNIKTLQRHMRVVHDINTVQQSYSSIMCDECGALVQTKHGLESHKAKCH